MVQQLFTFCLEMLQKHLRIMPTKCLSHFFFNSCKTQTGSGNHYDDWINSNHRSTNAKVNKWFSSEIWFAKHLLLFFVNKETEYGHS